MIEAHIHGRNRALALDAVLQGACGLSASFIFYGVIFALFWIVALQTAWFSLFLTALIYAGGGALILAQARGLRLNLPLEERSLAELQEERRSFKLSSIFGRGGPIEPQSFSPWLLPFIEGQRLMTNAALSLRHRLPEDAALIEDARSFLEYALVGVSGAEEESREARLLLAIGALEAEVTAEGSRVLVPSDEGRQILGLAPREASRLRRCRSLLHERRASTA